MATRVAFKTAGEQFPSQGNRELPCILDFTAGGTISESLFYEMSQSRIEMIQCVWIDNSLNAAPLTIQFRDTQHLINAQPFSQGIYPVISVAMEYTAITAAGIKIPVIFSNVAKPFFTNGPVPGVNVVPALTNTPIELAAAGDNVLVAGVAATTIKFYRQILAAAAATNIKFWSGPSANNKPLTGTFTLFAGGSITMEPSGIPWITTLPGDSLVMTSSQAVNIGGIIGFAQS